MRTRAVSADTIEAAAEDILPVLKEYTSTRRSVSSRDNVIYFDGWDGLGASAVLRDVAKRLTTSSPAAAGLEFDQVIHIDCSMWESRRALQRVVAEQLKLPNEVMELFDRQDEEDDFKGVALGSRAEVQQVLGEMQRHIQKLNRRFLVIFHNGSSEEIDLASCCGLPLSGFSTNKVLWTFQGRFRLKPRAKVDAAIESAGTTDVFLSNVTDDEELWSYLVQQEATEVAETCKSNTWPTQQVSECFLYMLQLCCRGSGHHSIDYDFSNHVANYWVCDGIIKQGQGERDDDLCWRAADALQREMPLDMDYHERLPSSHISKLVQRKPYWSSPSHGFTQIPPGVIPSINGGDMLQHCADKLRVLKLSRCTLDFQSPPFLCCHSLRFLWLDHCQGTRTTGTDEGVGKEEDIRRCFQRLWVLDVRYTDCNQILSAEMMDLMTHLRELNVMGVQKWDIGQLQGRLPNIRKLRVTKSRVRCSPGSEKNLFSEMKKMELLDFSGNIFYQSGMSGLSGPGVSSNNSSCCLETVTIVDGFRGYGVERISFRGCTNLKNIFFGGGMFGLRTLDISGTSVKTLDLTTTKIESLDELYLLGCEKLHAILWPPKEYMKQDLSKLCIDTTQSSAPPIAQSREGKAKRGTSTTTTTGTSTTAAELHEAVSGPTGEFGWYISVQDARLLSSLEPVYSSSREAYVEISSIAAGGGSSKDEGIKSGGGGSEQPVVPAIYKDIAVDHLQQKASEGGGDALGIMPMSPCPDAPRLLEKRCYMHLRDQMKTDLQHGSGGTSGIIQVPDFASKCGKILHVHDSLSITCTPSSRLWGSLWSSLEWCRIERCPKLDSVFDTLPSHGSIYALRTFWASQLIKARYICTSRGVHEFLHLKFLHLDLCPRLIHVLPISAWEQDHHNLLHLETLEIAWCGDLREIFPWHDTYYYYPAEIFTQDFPGLKRIHLHDLPSLQGICGVNKQVRMSAPNLETVKIRGCWSLRRLPYVDGSSKAVECDCEKDWWDKLEWEDASHRGQYRPIHPRYYKKKMLRGSVLR